VSELRNLALGVENNRKERTDVRTGMYIGEGHDSDTSFPRVQFSKVAEIQRKKIKGPG
jgi:hypothetical protein